MGNKNHPVRSGSIGPGDPAQFDYHQIINKIKAAESTSLHDLSSTYAALERLLGEAELDLAYHRGRLKGAWSEGPSSDAALAQIQRLEQAAHELAKVSGQFQNGLRAAGRTVDTYKSTLPSEATGPLGTVKDPATELVMEKSAKDREAQRHMTEMNNGLINAYAGIPASITLDLPTTSGDQPGPGGSGGGPAAGTSGSGSAGLGGPASGGASLPTSKPDTATPLPGDLSQPEEPAPVDLAGGAGSSGGTDLEGTKPAGGMSVPSGLGQPPGGTGAGPGTASLGGLGPGGLVPGPVPTGSGGLRPGPPPNPVPGARPSTGRGDLGSLRPPLNTSGVIGATPRTSGPGAMAARPGGTLRGSTEAGQLGPRGVLGHTAGSATNTGRTGAPRTPMQAGGGLGPASALRRDRRETLSRPSSLADEDDLWTDDDDTAPRVIR